MDEMSPHGVEAPTAAWHRGTKETTSIPKKATSRKEQRLSLGRQFFVGGTTFLVIIVYAGDRKTKRGALEVM